MKKMKVNPGFTRDNKDLRVLTENGTPLKRTEEGTEVPRTSFYNRLLKDKDLILVSTPKKRMKASRKKSVGKKITAIN